MLSGFFSMMLWGTVLSISSSSVWKTDTYCISHLQEGNEQCATSECIWRRGIGMACHINTMASVQECNMFRSLIDLIKWLDALKNGRNSYQHSCIRNDIFNDFDFECDSTLTLTWKYRLRVWRNKRHSILIRAVICNPCILSSPLMTPQGVPQ